MIILPPGFTLNNDWGALLIVIVVIILIICFLAYYGGKQEKETRKIWENQHVTLPAAHISGVVSSIYWAGSRSAVLMLVVNIDGGGQIATPAIDTVPYVDPIVERAKQEKQVQEEIRQKEEAIKRMSEELTHLKEGSK